MPVTATIRLSVPNTTRTCFCEAAEIALVPARLWTSAATSLSSSGRVVEFGAPGCAGRPERTTSRLLPSLEMSVLHLLGGAAADGDHGDDGGNADDDAEQRQERAQHVAANRDQSEADGLVKHHAACIASVSDSIWPSRKPMVRRA